MKTRHLGFLFCFLMAAFCTIVTPETSAADSVAVIAHRSVPEKELNKTKLLDIYSGDIKNWSDGKPVVVLDLKPTGEIKETFYKFLGKSQSRMKSIWIKRMLSGEGDPPVAVDSEAEMVKRVAATPGAIGFVSRASVNDTVKTLAIIEHEGDQKK
jgi:ABC-type phosphate transport system substrate-binding protein